MDTRSRFHAVMSLAPVDRVPWLEEGLRDDVLDRWRHQGMPAAGPASVFAYDRRERIEWDMNLRGPGVGGPVTREEMPHWRKNLDRPLVDRFGPEWPARVTAWRGRDHLLELPLHRGLLLTLGVDDWRGLEEAMYLLADDPAVVREAMELQGELAARVARHVLAEIDVDLVGVSEPIGGNHGPLVAPGTYRDLVLPAYAPALRLAGPSRVPARVFMTYANARCLLPDVVAAGFDCLWAMETETAAMDYRDVRREYGRSLRLIGGIDLDCLLAGESAIEREMKEKLPPLLGSGGYVPLADGRVRATMSWPAYACYRGWLQRLTT